MVKTNNMTVGELREKLKNIDDDVRIDFSINIKDYTDDRYDIDNCGFDILNIDCANDDGYIEFLTCL